MTIPLTNAEIFTGSTTDPYMLAVRAYVWGFPLVQMARIRLYGTQPDDPFGARPATSTGAPINYWGHQSQPSDPTFRAGVGPSVDLLYSSVRLDLDTGPFVVEVPDCGSRYYTVQIAYADSSADLSFGQRTHGRQLPPLFLHGPGSSVIPPPGMVAVQSPTRYCMLPTRFLFDPGDPADLEVVRGLQAQLRVRTWDAFQAGRDDLPPVPDQRRLGKATAVPGELPFLDELGSVLQDWVVRADEMTLLNDLERIGLRVEQGFLLPTSEQDFRVELERGLRDGAAMVADKALTLGTECQGWTTNFLGPRFGDDWLLRAGVAKDQIVVTIPEEALYPVCRVDSNGRPLDGRNCYTLQFDGDRLPPGEAFWSVTVYGDDGFLVPNAINRYAVSDRTPGLRLSADGSIAVTISHDRPAEPDANWLPAPASTFYLMLRIYLPTAQALTGQWQPPPVRRC